MLPLLFAALVTAQSGPPAAAQAPIKTELVIRTDAVGIATTLPVAAVDLPRPAATLSAPELRDLGVSSPVDAFRLLPGVDVRARGPLDVQSDFSLRGSTFGQNLVLVDGIRINDSQTGHHNGELPITMAGLGQIEFVGGAASAAHGADALGGVINVVTRMDRHHEFTAAGGDHALAAFSASARPGRDPRMPTVMGWYQRSDGFMFDRDFALGGGAVRGAARAVSYNVRHTRRAFGANGFYGNSPSKEWTDQTIASATWMSAAARPGNGSASLSWDVTGTWRNHGDHFRWDINRPGFAENRHRTNAADIRGGATWLGRALVLRAGADAGADWVRSNNLGDRDYRRVGAFVEVQPVDTAHLTYQLAVRADRYSTFGSNVSPTGAASWSFGNGWRARASAGRAFRVPTYTELYYHDPANLGSPDLVAERGWTMDGGVDYGRNGWTMAVTPFARWDDNVIDWVRESPADLWRSRNVRDVTTRGVEFSATRRFDGGLARVAYTRLDVGIPAFNQLSKYVLEYAKDSLVVSGTAPIGRTGLSVTATADHRNRLDGQQYTLLSARASYTRRHATFFVDGTNLLDREYHEVAGVAMPGRWISLGVTLR
jgi:iron complex outermembrane receptor protein